MLLGFDYRVGVDGPGLLNLLRLGSLWRRVGQLCVVVLSGLGWDRVSCGPGLF